jgi:hypothetical protein
MEIRNHIDTVNCNYDVITKVVFENYLPKLNFNFDFFKVYIEKLGTDNRNQITAKFSLIYIFSSPLILRLLCQR